MNKIELKYSNDKEVHDENICEDIIKEDLPRFFNIQKKDKYIFYRGFIIVKSPSLFNAYIYFPKIDEKKKSFVLSLENVGDNIRSIKSKIDKILKKSSLKN